MAFTSSTAELRLLFSDFELTEVEGEFRASATLQVSFAPRTPLEATSPATRITSPIGTFAHRDLSWYLEKSIGWPLELIENRNKELQSNLRSWGKALYSILKHPQFASPYHIWLKQPADFRMLTISVDMNRSDDDAALASILTLPWELIHDEHGFLADQPIPMIVRRNTRSTPSQQSDTKLEKPRILLVSPRPENSNIPLLDRRASAQAILEAVAATNGHAEVVILAQPTFEAMVECLSTAHAGNNPFTILHFDGHGIYDETRGQACLIFEEPDQQGNLYSRRPKAVGAKSFADALAANGVRLALIEACQSAKAETDASGSIAVQALVCGGASVIAMSHTVLVETSRRFFERFFGVLLNTGNLYHATILGQQTLRSNPWRAKNTHERFQLDDWFVPVLYDDTPSVQFEPQCIPTKELSTTFSGDTVIGRSRDFLAAERSLLHHNIAVITGEHGIGKTQLAHELARWWLACGRADNQVRITFAPPEMNTGLNLTRAIIQQLPSGMLFEIEGAFVVNNLQPFIRTVIVIDELEIVYWMPDQSEQFKSVMESLMALISTGYFFLIITSCAPLPPLSTAANSVPLSRLKASDAYTLASKAIDRPITAEDRPKLQVLVELTHGHPQTLVSFAAPCLALQEELSLKAIIAGIAKTDDTSWYDHFVESARKGLRWLSKDARTGLATFLCHFTDGISKKSVESLGLGDGLLTSILVPRGLASECRFGYILLHPALAFALSEHLDEHEEISRRSRWEGAVRDSVLELLESSDGMFVREIARLDAENILAFLALEHPIDVRERIMSFSTAFERIYQYSEHPTAHERVIEIQRKMVSAEDDWGHVQFLESHGRIQRKSEALQGKRQESAFVDLLRETQAAIHRFEAVKSSSYGSHYDEDFAQAMCDLGRALMLAGEHNSALSVLSNARARFARLSESRDLALEEAYCITDQAVCFMRLSFLDEAEDAYEAAQVCFQACGDRRAIAIGHFQLGVIKRMRGRYDQALVEVENALSRFERLEERLMIYAARYQLGLIKELSGHPEDAEAEYLEAIRLCVELNDRGRKCECVVQLGTLYANNGRWVEATQFFETAANLATELGSGAHEAMARTRLANCLRHQGRVEEAKLEMRRALDCNPEGILMEYSWRKFMTIHELNLELGNAEGAVIACRKAQVVYGRHLRAGGEPEAGSGRMCRMVLHAIGTGHERKARAHLETLLHHPTAPVSFVRACVCILDGERDPSILEEFQLAPLQIVELDFLLDELDEIEARTQWDEAALKSSTMRIATRRRLVRQNVELFKPGLASCLEHLGHRFIEAGRMEAAVMAMQESIVLHRELSEDCPEVFSPRVAAAVSLLGAMGSGLGRFGALSVKSISRIDALALTREAVDIYRKLTEARPAHFLPYFAWALTNHSSALVGSQVGHEEARSASLEAVAHFRVLVGRSRKENLPGLAMALSVNGSVLNSTGSPSEALESIAEGVDVYRTLAISSPDRYLIELVMALGEKGRTLYNLGQYELALSAYAEGVHMSLPVLRARPRAILHIVCKLLYDYSITARKREADFTKDLVDLVLATWLIYD